MGLGFYVALHLEWSDHGTDETLHKHMKRIAYACRYGKAAAFVWEMDSDLLGRFCEAVGEIVEEENRRSG